MKGGLAKMNYLNSPADYYHKVIGLLFQVSITTKEGTNVSIDMVYDVLNSTMENDGKLVFLGNGASASMASHFSLDFCKTLGFNAITLNDPVWLTAFSNDYGQEEMFREPIALLCQKRDVLMAISSSGESANIINAAQVANAIGMPVITFTGFESANTLRKQGDINYHVPHASYGIVESIHTVLLHMLLDCYQTHLTIQ
jgi:D-sedoheptulose 7-phosphate isomerase